MHPHSPPPQEPKPKKDGCPHCSWKGWETQTWMAAGFFIFVLLFMIAVNLSGTYSVRPACGEKTRNEPSLGYRYHVATEKDDCLPPMKKSPPAPGARNN